MWNFSLSTLEWLFYGDGGGRVSLWVHLGRMEVPVALPVCNFHSCYYEQFVHDLIGQWQGWLGKGAGWHPQNGLFYRSITVLLCWCHTSASPDMRHKYFHVLRSFTEVYLYTAFPDHLFTKFPIIFFPNLWPASQTSGNCLWIDTEACLLLFIITNKINNQWHCFLLPAQSLFSTVLQACPRNAAVWASLILLFFFETYYIFSSMTF